MNHRKPSARELMEEACVRGGKTPAEARAMLDQLGAHYRNTGDDTMTDQAVTQALQQVGTDLKAYAKNTKESLAETKARLLAVEQAVANMPGEGGMPGGFAGGPSLGARAAQEFADGHQAFEHLRGGNIGSATIALDNTSIRAALVNEGGSNSNTLAYPSQPEQRGAVGPGLRSLRLLEALPSRPTSSDSVTHVRIEADSNAAEQADEGDEKQHVDVTGTLVKADIATVAAWTSASKQVLADQGALMAQIDRLFRHKVLTRLEYLIINGGSGSGATQSRITGLLESSAFFIPTIATTPADIIGEALVRMADNGFTPNLVILNPLDWFKIQITRATVETASYIFSSPTMPIPPALWNTSVVPTPSIAEGKAMVLDTSYSTVLERESVQVQLSNSHADFFVRNLIALRAELRAGLEVLNEWSIFEFDISGS